MYTLENVLAVLNRQAARLPHMRNKAVKLQVGDGEPTEDFDLSCVTGTDETVLVVNPVKDSSEPVMPEAGDDEPSQDENEAEVADTADRGEAPKTLSRRSGGRGRKSNAIPEQDRGEVQQPDSPPVEEDRQ